MNYLDIIWIVSKTLSKFEFWNFSKSQSVCYYPNSIQNVSWKYLDSIQILWPYGHCQWISTTSLCMKTEIDIVLQIRKIIKYWLHCNLKEWCLISESLFNVTEFSTLSSSSDSEFFTLSSSSDALSNSSDAPDACKTRKNSYSYELFLTRPY